MCFLEREVYAFLSTFDKRDERVRGAMLRARIFCLWGGRGKRHGRRATEQPRIDGGRYVRGVMDRAAPEERHMGDAREREEGFLFL